MSCDGLGDGTLVAYERHGHWGAMIVLDRQITLSAADKRTLRAITPSPGRPGRSPADRPTPRELESAGGTYELTVVADPNGTYVTGLSAERHARPAQGRRAGRGRGLRRRPAARRGARHAVGPAVTSPAAPGGGHRVPGGRAAARIRRGGAAPGRAGHRPGRPRPARWGSPSTACSGTSRRRCGGARRARPGCAGSPPTPATSCAPRWPPSAATPSWGCCTRATPPTRSPTRSAGCCRSPPG